MSKSTESIFYGMRDATTSDYLDIGKVNPCFHKKSSSCSV